MFEPLNQFVIVNMLVFEVFQLLVFFPETLFEELYALRESLNIREESSKRGVGGEINIHSVSGLVA